MNVFQLLVRVFIAVAVITSLFAGDIEYSTALVLLSGIYILAFLLTPKNSTGKYLVLLMDIVFLSIAIYLTGYTSLSILVVPLFAEFVKDIKDIGYFSLLSVVPIAISLYVSGFNDYIFLPIILAGVMGIAGLYKTFADREDYFRQLKNEMENLYIKNISFQEIIDLQGKFNRLYSSLKEMREKKHPIKIWIYDINEKLGTDGIVFFDLQHNRCYSTGKTTCRKELLEYIDEPFMVFKNHPVNSMFDAPYVYVITVEDRDKVYGVFAFVSKLKEIDPQLIKMVSEQLLLYFLENSDDKPSNKNSGVASSRKEEGKGD